MDTLIVTPTIASKIGFASHQNSVAALQELSLENTGEEPLRDLTIRLDANPVFLEPKIWKVDVLEANSALRIQDRNLKLEAGYLSNLSESVLGEISLEISQEDGEETKLLFKKSYPIEILAKNHWGGTGSMPELLPAFCMPNDPAVDKVLKAASDVLRRAGKDSGINGYNNRSRSRTWELASAIWSAVAGLQISYTLPPASFEIEGQKIRTPGAIIEGRLATCLDTSMLFASAMEQAQLNPLIIMTQGHAFVGVWLQPQEFAQLTTDEAAAVRKRIELQEILVFETTLATQTPAPNFSAAVAAANKQLIDDSFHMAIDIRRGRMRKIKPLGFVTSSQSGIDGSEPETIIEAFEEAPPLPGFDVEIKKEPEDANDRVAQWQRKLLDLTARNRLLNLPERSKHVPLFCPDPGALEDLLAAGKAIRISPIPDFEQGGRDAQLYEQQNNEDLRERYASEAMHSREVLSPLPKKKLEADLVDLYRKANTDMAEGGANTLFLALGFLKWKKTAEDPRSYRAPLILLPVKLKRKSALSGVTMIAHEDEPRFNLTLLELLSQDFDLNLPELDGDLPEDHSGIDVSGIWNHVRLAVKDIPGFEVTTDTAIGTFSFAKYLMWKDLTDRREQLSANAVVKHLMERGEDKFESHYEYPDENELDAKVSPSEVFTPLPADSSQLAAVIASAKGCNFVLDGPPGTGKSQTIANMIAHNLSIGKRVLFVAEKMAALDVVYRRLEAKGLGVFCLETHSNKTSKSNILNQLDAAWDTRGDLTKEEWQKETGRLKRLRDRLNGVCECLHKIHPNGMSIHQAIGLSVKDHRSTMPRLSWAGSHYQDAGTYERMRETAHRLDLNHDAYSNAPKEFSIIEPIEWSNGWQTAIIGAAQDLSNKVSKLESACDALKSSCQFEAPTENAETIERLAGLVETILSAHGKDLSIFFLPDFKTRSEAAKQFLQILENYKAEEKGLSANYTAEAARNIDVDRLESTWNEASGKFWFLATLACKKASKELGQQGGTNTVPDVAKDIPHLRHLKDLLDQIDQLAPKLDQFPGYSGLKSRTAEIIRTIEISETLQKQLPMLTSSPDEHVSLKSSTRLLVVEANELLDPDGAISLSLTRLQDSIEDYHNAFKLFSELCAISEPQALALVQIRKTSGSIGENEASLRSWCAWQRVRQFAITQKLTPLIESIENGSLGKGEIEKTFQAAYAKWFAAEQIDKEPILRDFVAAEHIDCIEEFRRADDQVAELSVKYTRSVLSGNLPIKSEVGRKDGYGILKHELQKKRAHKPLRQLASEMGDAFSNLAPCMLMSPLSIAQYLPTEHQLFDLVIFDEASQIAPWDAVGSIARGKQVVIAGDPRQMPPTNFFQRGTVDSQSDGDTDGDLESILDECMAVGIPRHSLSWHYRSRHESLIMFSNHRYYGGNLITFPAAVTRDSAVSWRHVDGVYAKGKGRTNQNEAKAIVAETLQRLKDPSFFKTGKSIGIITLNADQQKLIEDLLDEARQKNPEIEPFFSDELAEPVFVKNLETVQGDERDIILLGTCYGPTSSDSEAMSMNFGPLNRDGGERRLNVAISRSKEEMIVFTSFVPSMINLNRTSARAVRDLKHFLEFADRGPRALAEAVMGSVGGYDSPFEEAVANRLQDKGWEVVPQVGVSRFRIDLGIVHPDRPGDFLVGVECDGATYHSAATARDRDKVRAAVLEGLGWKLLRIWSTDWFVNQEQEVERVVTALQGLYEDDVVKSKEAAVLIIEKENQSNDIERTLPTDEETPSNDQFSEGEETSANIPDSKSLPYQETDYVTFVASIDPERFYDKSYTPVLRDLVRHTIEIEAPLVDDLLIQKIARAHNFKRAGRLIRERVYEVIDSDFHAREDPIEGVFIWKNKEDPYNIIMYRIPTDKGYVRFIDEIPHEEIAVLLADKREEDPIKIARTFGIKRLTASARERIEAVLDRYKSYDIHEK